MQPLSFIPSVSKILEDPILDSYKRELSFLVVSYTVKKTLAMFKQEVQDRAWDIKEPTPVFNEVLSRTVQELTLILRSKTQAVVNATGITLHTNLGRSPLSLEIWSKIQQTMTHYSSLELDLQTGKRGKRKSLVPQLLSHYLGQPLESTDVLVVNNNAAALFLFLSTFPKGKEVVISRGELVQIGGGFRIPEILEQTGLKLKEVGTTNITTLQDYKNAINPETVLILKVHASNFAIRGFTKSVGTQELAQICPPSVVFAVDQGSGLLKEDKFGEESAESHLNAGAHIVLFSGDKLLGGPQAGIAIGKKDVISRMEKHPLMRVCRVGKMISTYLEECLISYINQTERPVSVSHFSKPLGQLQDLAERVSKQFAHIVEPVKTTRVLGGGSTPDFSIPSYGVSLKTQQSADNVLAFFRNYKTPIIGYIEKNRVIFDFSTFLEGDMTIFSSALSAWVRQER